MNLAHLLLGPAREVQDLPAFARADAPHLTYRDLWREVSIIGMHLGGRFGLQRGDRMAFALSNALKRSRSCTRSGMPVFCAVPMSAKLHARGFA